MSVTSLYTPCFVMFCVFLYGPFCHGAHTLDLSTLFTSFIFRTSLPFILSTIVSYQIGLIWYDFTPNTHVTGSNILLTTQFISARPVWWRWRSVTTLTCLSSSMSRQIRMPEICYLPPTTATSKNWSLRCEKTCLRSAQAGPDGYKMHILNKTKE